MNKNNPIRNQKKSDSEATSPSSIDGKLRIKKSYINKTVRLYNWNKLVGHIESYTLTVLRYQKWSNTTEILMITQYFHLLSILKVIKLN